MPAVRGILRAPALRSKGVSMPNVWRAIFKGSLTLAVITCGFLLSATPRTLGDPSLVGHWSLDEGTGTSTADASGNGNNGTLQSGPVWTAGVAGSALQFDGLSSLVNVADSSTLDIGTSDFTLLAWVKRNNSATGGVLSKTLLGYQTGYFFGIQPDGKLQFELSQSPGGPPNWTNGFSTGMVPVNTWHHVAVTFVRSGSATFYIDGTASGSVSISTVAGDISNVRPLYIGASEGTNNTLIGSLDEPKVFTRALSPAEIRGEVLPAGHWPLDEGTSTSTADASGNGNNGTLQSGPVWTTGVSGPALQFDGLSSLVNVPDSSTLDIGTSDFTLASWVKRTNTVTGGIISKTLLSYQTGYFFGVQPDGKLYFELSQSPGGPPNWTNGFSTGMVPVNTWHHVAVTFVRSGSATFYIDGNASGGVSISAVGGDVSNARPLYIGASEGDPNTLNGSLDEPKVFTRALSLAEVQKLSDADGDTILDAIDNCPAWPNPAQTLPSWTVPTDDSECDGFPATVTIGARGREDFMGTDPTDHCADTTTLFDEEGPGAGEPLSPWPPDINDNRAANLSDVVLFGPTFNKSFGQAGYNPRMDLTAGPGLGAVNLSDLVAIGPFFNKFCSP